TRATLRGVWVQTPMSAWAVGDDGVVIHWNGHEWTRVTLAGHDHLTCIWGHPAEGMWIGASRNLLYYGPDGRNTILVQSGAEIRAIWGTGPKDVWFLGAGRTVMHWPGE